MAERKRGEIIRYDMAGRKNLCFCSGFYRFTVLFLSLNSLSLILSRPPSPIIILSIALERERERVSDVCNVSEGVGSGVLTLF